jgi:hypothetical protein
MRNSSPDGLSSGSFRSPGWYKVGGTVLAKWYSPSKMVVLMAVQPRRWCAFENKKVDSVRNYPYHYYQGAVKPQEFPFHMLGQNTAMGY